MVFHYAGKFSGKESDLPVREQEGSVPFKEPDSMKKLSVIVNGISIVIAIATFVLFFVRIGLVNMSSPAWYIGIVMALVVMVPHEFLHGICFNGDVYMYQNLKQGMLFVVGTEDMSRARFIFMSMLPNLAFGFIPYIVFMLFPQLQFLGVFGAMGIAAGAGDYLNVFNALTQVPADAQVFMSGMHSFWYKKGA